MTLKFPLFYLICLINCLKINGAVVQLTNGLIQGYSVKANGVQVNVFKGIPFAAPPLGPLRFNLPQQPQSWSEIRNTTKYAPACLTNATITHSVQNYTSEDCLYLNVFADSRCSTFDPCPVVFMVHGGAYQGDSATMFNETQLIGKYASDRLILILPSYRLGIMGLLDLGDEKSQNTLYNLAVHDMIFALKWTQREIGKMGGDPGQVTLFGYSSSGATLNALLASPALANEDLFAQAYITSGCSRLMPHFSKSMAIAVVDYVGCNSPESDLQSQVECLRSKPAKELIDAMRATVDNKWWQIGIQSDSTLFPAPSLVGLERHWKAKPIMIIGSKMELKELELKGRSLPHVCMHYILVFGYFEEATLRECIKRYKTINETETHPYYKNVTYIMPRDLQHAMSVLLAQWNTQQGQPTYLGLLAQKEHDTHVADLYYLIGFHLNEFNWTKEDTMMEQFYVPAVKRFFKGKSPSDTWQSSTPDGLGYMHLAFNSSSTPLETAHFVKNEVYNKDAVDFWLIKLKDIEMKEWKKKGKKYDPERMDSFRPLNLMQVMTQLNDNVQENDDSPQNSLPPHYQHELRPFHNFYLTFFAFISLVIAFTVILLLFDTYKSGRLFNYKANEATEQTVLFHNNNSVSQENVEIEERRRRYDAI